MNNSIKYFAACTALTGVLFSGIALADKDDASRLAEAKITLTEAIAIAEKHQSGQAYDASLDHDKKSGLHYEVDVVVGDKTYEVTIDGVSGAVAGVTEDHDD